MKLSTETVRLGDHDYMGQVAVYQDRDRLYVVKSHIRRLTREDAFLDADRMFEEANKSGVLE